MSEQFPILVVDDEPDIVEVLNRVALNCFPEAKFSYVSSYVEAVAYLDGLKGWVPKLVLLDLDLQSSLSGFDFLSRMRSRPQGRLVPVVILSYYSSKQNRDQAFRRGANAFTGKPFSYSAWQSYVTQLRDYWFKTVTIPKLYFDK